MSVDKCCDEFNAFLKDDFPMVSIFTEAHRVNIVKIDSSDGE